MGRDLDDLPAGALVLVGCSGGPDSLALAAGLAWWARGPRGGGRRRGGAVVVDHDLQEGSADVAARAAAACRGLGLDPVEVVRLDLPPGAGAGGGSGSGSGGPEARARAGRHAALAAAAAATGAAAVLLGHTRDDQAEQVLLSLARGSGARSLAGIPPRRGLLRRPLLDLPRATTRAACVALGLEPWHDPTNDDPREVAPQDPGRRRALVRASALPRLEADLGPGVAASLARSAALLREDADLLESLAAELLERASPPWVSSAGDVGEVVLAADVLAAGHPALRGRALHAAARRAGAPAGAVSAAHVEALDRLVTAWRGQGPTHLPGGVEARRACGRLLLAPAPADPAPPARTPQHLEGAATSGPSGPGR
ncbi:tRNA lysidine(34) synthetase TilS [Pseudokineococcus basanitobsidens]|uniref:tRNA(Ile)-lysidine synthase n=1 Tax=Pseudokineococcus basanitobsidens TaxID=1926649 RepID=A0ABU8RGK2_9ACTN